VLREKIKGGQEGRGEGGIGELTHQRCASPPFVMREKRRRSNGGEGQEGKHKGVSRSFWGELGSASFLRRPHCELQLQ